MANQLNQLNADILKQVDDFLDVESKIPTRTGLQLTVGMMAEIYKSQNEIIKKVNEQNDRVGKLERNSVVLWAKANPKMFILGVLLFIVTHESIDWTGLFPSFIHAIMKWLGLA